jgi:hypothetical protein
VKKTENVDCRKMVPPSCQCTNSHNIIDVRVLGKGFNSGLSTASLFTCPILHRFFLAPRIEVTLKRRRFKMVEDIITNMTDGVRAIQQTFFELCF